MILNNNIWYSDKIIQKYSQITDAPKYISQCVPLKQKRKESYTIYSIASWIGEVQTLDNDSYFSKQIQEGGNATPDQGTPELTQTRNKTLSGAVGSVQTFLHLCILKASTNWCSTNWSATSNTKLKKNSLIAQEKAAKRTAFSLWEFQMIPSILHSWLYCIFYFVS